MDFETGEVLLIDKPKGWTSFDVVKKIRNIIRVKKVGHAGTLDPLATGLLILCTGKQTKSISQIQDQEKVYEVVFKLGATTASYDAECPEESLQDASHIEASHIQAVLPQFTGLITQTPPVYSAVKVNGKRAYKAARKGQAIEIKSREVEVYTFELLAFESPSQVMAKVICSKGTYIRTLVHDLGQALGVGAYITDLRRTHIGAYDVEKAWLIENFQATYGQKPRDL